MASSRIHNFAEEPGLNSLPNEVINEIFSYLDFKDLIHCGLLNKRLNTLSNQDVFWKEMCTKYWLENKCPSNRTWKNHFACWYKDMGSYIDHYADIKSAWDKMLNYLRKHCAIVFKTIKNGTSEEKLNALEVAVGFKLPKDFRCSYRIHNGQKSTYAGLMGNCYHYQTSQRILDIEKILELIQSQFKTSDSLRGCIPLTYYAWFSSRGHVAQYLAIDDCDGYDVNTVFHPAYKIRRHEDDAFITGTSFKEWLITYANHLSQGHFSLVNGRISRYLIYPVCEEITEFITISIRTCFQPEISQVFPPHFEYDYHVIMSMSEESPESLILQSSIWVTDNGTKKEWFHVRTHREPRLLGPGGTLTWSSTTFIDKIQGTITGTFYLENQATGDLKAINCPVATLNSLPFITAKERKSRRKKIFKT